MILFAVDPGSRSGFAIGKAGAAPRAGAVRLKKAGEPGEKAVFNFAAFLRDNFEFEKPDLYVQEHFLDPRFSLGADAAILGVELYGVAVAMCGLYSVRMVSPEVNAVRQFLCGKTSALPPRRKGSAPRTVAQREEARKATKRMVIDRCHQLGLLAGDVFDDNQADAIALHAYASMRFVRIPPQEFVLFQG
jgi:hypothetical protein